MSSEAKTSDAGPGDGRKPVTWGVEQEAAASATNTSPDEAKQNVDPNQPALGESVKMTSIRRTESQQREWEARQDPLYSCKSCYGNWTRTPLGSAISREYSYLFNFIIAHLLFWAIAFPIILDHGYDNEIGTTKDAPWGSQGTGVFPVSLALVIVATLLFVTRVVRCGLVLSTHACARRVVYVHHVWWRAGVCCGRGLPGAVLPT